MPDAPPFGNDVLPALQTLLRHLEPHAKILIFIFLVLNPYNGLHEWDKVFPSHMSTWLLLIVLALYGGYLKIPGLEIHNTVSSAPTPAATTSAIPLPAASLAEPLLALQSIYRNLKPYFRVGLLLWLTYCVYYQTPIFSPSWPFYLLPFGLAILGYFSPTTRFYGPIRFGYLEYSQHFAQAYKVFLDWWAVALVIFLPFPGLLFPFGVGIAVFSLAAWVRLSFSYRKELRAIASQVAKETLRAKAAAAAARDEASSFHRYEDQVTQAATSARRDAVLSNAVRFTDFFDCAARAWSALGQVTQAAQVAVDKADDLIEAATDAQEADKPDEDEEGGESHTELLARYLQETAEGAQSKANDVVLQLKVAQEAVTRSNAASEQDSKARAAAETNALAALAVTRRISGRAAGLLTAEAEAARQVDEVSLLAERALSAARGGEMARARQIAVAAKTAADSADEALSVVRAARAETLKDLLQWLQSSRTGGS